MKRHTLILASTPVAALLCAAGSRPLHAGPRPSPTPAAASAGVVSHVQVLSDRIEDVSSMEAWKRSFIKDGMTDEQKALAVWQSVVKFRQQDPPPNEFLQYEANVHDPIKTFNVYGYGMCCCASSNVEALARYAGLQARGRIINTHSVPEIYWDGAWHLLDASLITYFPKADGKLAGVDEIIGGIKTWYGQHPDMKGNDKALRAFMRGGGWRKGPEILSRSLFYDENGWLPAATHGWYSTMQEYDGSQDGVTEYAYSQGYQVNVQLRPGELLTRRWSNKGLHVNALEGDSPGCLKCVVGQGDLRYAPRYGDLALGRIGNGTLEYEVPLADSGFRDAALEAENLVSRAEDRRGPALHAGRPDRPGVLVLRMPSSYVYLGGEALVDATVAPGGSLQVLFSDNNGLDWRLAAELTASARGRKIDLKSLVYRRYDYRLKLVLKGAGTGLDRLHLTHDVQHSQRALPALAKGENMIRFSAGPPDGTVTIEGSLDASARGKQLLYTDFHPEVKGLKEPWLVPTSGSGTITFPVQTPGELTRLRFGCYYRARDARDLWDLQVSFDGGKTYRTVDRCQGPFVGNCKYVTFSDVPAGTRSALVRWSGSQRNTLALFNLRLDADYREPHGGFRPVKVTYVWDEGGVEKRDVHVARTPSESYPIRCPQAPVMKSLSVELAE